MNKGDGDFEVQFKSARTFIQGRVSGKDSFSVETIF